MTPIWKVSSAADVTDREPLNPQFRSWLIQRMYELRCQKIDEQVERFEVVANALCHTERRPLDFEALAEISGHAAHLLRDTMKRLTDKLDLVEVTRDHEGTWYSLKHDPFGGPPEEIDPGPDVESSIERLYRECCDEINDGLRKVVKKLESTRPEVEPAVGALLMDACADILSIREKLTRISATGVKRDRETYISGIREDLREILRGDA